MTTGNIEKASQLIERLSKLVDQQADLITETVALINEYQDYLLSEIKRLRNE